MPLEVNMACELASLLEWKGSSCPVAPTPHASPPRYVNIRNMRGRRPAAAHIARGLEENRG